MLCSSQSDSYTLRPPHYPLPARTIRCRPHSPLAPALSGEEVSISSACATLNDLPVALVGKCPSH